MKLIFAPQWLAVFFCFLGSAAFPQKQNRQSQLISIADFEKENPALQLTAYSDKTSGGASTSTMKLEYDASRKSRWLSFAYLLEKKDWPYEPYAGVSCQLPAGVPKTATGIAYDFKGSAHSMVCQSGVVKDYAFHEKHIRSSSSWTNVKVWFSQLKQPSWGSLVSFNSDSLTALAWQFVGTTGDSGLVHIDNVRFIYDAPDETTASKNVKVIDVGTIATLHSHILNEDRSIYIHLPYDEDYILTHNRRYPVIYILDAEASFKTLSAMLLQLQGMSMPEAIVVGIPNTNRLRDLTFSTFRQSTYSYHTFEQFKSSGGGERFLSFLEKELFPKIDSLYPTTGYRMLIGHSLGGLEVMYALLHRPDLLDGYLAIDPSLWWNKDELLEQADSALKKSDLQGKRLFIASAHTFADGLDSAQATKDRSESSSHFRSIVHFNDALSDNAKKISWISKYYPRESHATIPVIAEYDGLHYLLNNEYLPFMDQVGRLSFSADSAFRSHYLSWSAQMGYTVQPSQKLVMQCVNICVQSANYKDAKALCAYAIENFPKSNEAYEKLGDCYVKTNEKEKATEAYEHALSLKSSIAVKLKLEQIKK